MPENTPSVVPDAVDPALVPFRTLNTGATIPALGLGTFGSDKYSNEQIAGAVVDAARVGYRHFDCAAVYANEADIGKALQTVQADGVKRADLFVTSKVWNDKHARVPQSCEQSLRDLQLDYLDLFLVHWPFPNAHGKGVDVSSRDPHAVPYIHEKYMDTWVQMESLVDRGLVRAIGTSNMTVPKLKRVLRDCRIRPAANEMEMHPHFQQPELFRFVTENGIVPIGYSPIGSPSRPARDRTPEDTVDMDDPVIVSIAERLGLSPAAVCVKWGVQHGQVAIPFSVKRSQYLSTLQAVVSDPLTGDEMKAIAGIDRNNRLIKGHVFLWQGAADWHALWDENGEIENGEITQ